MENTHWHKPCKVCNNGILTLEYYGKERAEFIRCIHCGNTEPETMWEKYTEEEANSIRHISPAPRTCEYCKFWSESLMLSDNGIGKCSNPKVDIHVMFVTLAGVPIDEITLYYPKDFGCIFWEGKE